MIENPIVGIQLFSYPDSFHNIGELNTIQEGDCLDILSSFTCMFQK